MTPAVPGGAWLVIVENDLAKDSGSMTSRATARVLRRLGTIGVLLVPAGAAATPAVDGSAYDRNEGLSVGFAIGRYQDDFQLGAKVSSPLVLEAVRVTLGGAVGWYPGYVDDAGEQAWKPYQSVRLLLEGGQRFEDTPFRLYGIGGSILYFVPSELSGDDVAIGGYGAFGFEFYLPGRAGDGPVSYCIELGGIGGPHADKLPGKPSFATGFLPTTGFNVYLWCA